MQLRDLIADMMAIQAPLGESALAARRDPSKKHELIQLRKRFSEIVRDISSAIDADDRLRADPELAHEFRRRFSQMRSRVAVFQAKWPASLLDENPEFDEHAEQLRDSNREFRLWVNETMKRLS